MRSGRKVPTPAIPMPDFAVPYAAPAPESNPPLASDHMYPSNSRSCGCVSKSRNRYEGAGIHTAKYHGRRNTALEKENVSNVLSKISGLPQTRLRMQLISRYQRTNPMKGANFGLNSDSAMVGNRVLFGREIDRSARCLPGEKRSWTSWPGKGSTARQPR